MIEINASGLSDEQIEEVEYILELIAMEEIDEDEAFERISEITWKELGLL
jgi:hypothetical protein